MRLINLFADGVLLRHDGPRHRSPMVHTISVADMRGTPLLYLSAFFSHPQEERIANDAISSLGTYFKRQGNFNVHGLMAMGIEAKRVLNALHKTNNRFDIGRPIIDDVMHDTAHRYAAKAYAGFGTAVLLQQSPFPQ